jgi:hypothetical protein
MFLIVALLPMAEIADLFERVSERRYVFSPSADDKRNDYAVGFC